MKNIVIHGCYNTKNFGDLLLLDLVGAYIDDQNGYQSACPWVLNEVRDSLLTRSGNGLISCVTSKRAIFGGGGYFVDSPGLLRPTLKILRYSLPARLFKLLGIPYIIVGIGAGPYLSRFARHEVSVISNGADFVLARDEESRALLSFCGVADNKLSVTADLVLAMSWSDIPESALTIAKALISDSKKRKLGIHISIDLGDELNSILKLIRQLSSDLTDIELYWFYDHGEKTLEYVTNYFRNCENIDIIPRQDHWSTAAFIGLLDGVITTKLHVGITAFSLGVPPCGFSKHGKTKRFYSQIGRQQFQKEFGTDVSPIKTWIKLFAENYDQFSKVDEKKSAEVKQLAAENYSKITQWLSN